MTTGDGSSEVGTQAGALEGRLRTGINRRLVVGEQEGAHIAWQQQKDTLTWTSQILSVTDTVLSTFPVSLPGTSPFGAPA